MSDLIVRREVRFGTTGTGKSYRLYFDTGSPHTFVRASIALHTRTVLPLPDRPKRFHGMGNGAFVSTHICYFEVRLLGVWCSHTAFVLEDTEFEDAYDFLAGHDFTQRFDARLDTKRKRLILDRAVLQRADFIR